MSDLRLNVAREEHLNAFSPYVAPRAKIGRPSSYDPSVCGRVIELAADGHTIGAIAAVLGISTETLQEWRATFPEFSAAVSRAKNARQLFYEGHLIDVARRGGDNSRLNAVRFGLINVAPEEWKERLNTSVDVSITLASLITDSMKTIEGEVAPALEAPRDRPPADLADDAELQTPETDLFA